MARHTTWIVPLTTAILLACALARADDQAPTTRPVIPALSTDSPTPFIVEGKVDGGKGQGFEFHVATDGTARFVGVYDMADGTPLFLYDGQQTLIYDVPRARIVQIIRCHAAITVDWTPGDEKPFSFHIGIGLNRSDKGGDPSSFRIDRFVEDVADKWKASETPNAERSFVATRKDGSTDTLTLFGNDSTRFAFASRKKGNDRDTIQLEAKNIGQPLQRGSLAFPKIDQLRKDVPLDEVSGNVALQIMDLFRTGTAFAIKTAINGTPEDRAEVSKVFTNLDWETLRKRDAELSPRYRAALARQGVYLPATRPAVP